VCVCVCVCVYVCVCVSATPYKFVQRCVSHLNRSPVAGQRLRKVFGTRSESRIRSRNPHASQRDGVEGSLDRRERGKGRGGGRDARHVPAKCLRERRSRRYVRNTKRLCCTRALGKRRRVPPRIILAPSSDVRLVIAFIYCTWPVPAQRDSSIDIPALSS